MLKNNLMIFLFVIVLILPSLSLNVFGQSSNPVYMKDHKQYVNPIEMSTKMEHNGAILMVHQTISKLEYQVGEKITIQCLLVNIGNNSITISNLVPLLQSSVTYLNGSTYFPINFPHLLIGGDVTIKPNMEISDPDCHPSVGDYPNPASIVKIDTPGTYNITSFAYFTIHENSTQVSFEPLWSIPVQIIILPEKVPEFPFAIPILLVGITSLIVFYRMKFRK